MKCEAHALSKRANPARFKKAITRDILHRLVSVTSKLGNPYNALLLKAALLLTYHACLMAGELHKSKNLIHTIKISKVFLVWDPVNHIIIALKS